MKQPDGALRVLIVDDERHARLYVRKLLDEKVGFEVIGEARSVLEAHKIIADNNPDLVLLDIQMPGGVGLELIEQIGVDEMPATVFITAYRDYAVRAFEYHAVGYLLKPFTPDQFWNAIKRARDLIVSGKQATRFREMMSRALSEFELTFTSELKARSLPEFTGKTSLAQSTEYLQRIAVDGGQKSEVVSMADVSWFSASGSYTEIHHETRKHLARHSLDWFEEHLNPKEFKRIHRSFIVNVSCIKSIDRSLTGQSKVMLTCGKSLPVSRRKRSALMTLLKVAK